MTKSSAKAVMVVNTRSRSGQRWFDRACARFDELDYLVDAYAVDDPRKLDQVVTEALRSDPEVLILGGGDGTISCMVDLIVGKGVKLGVLPLGTANSFSRSLGIPLDVNGAVDVIVNGAPRRIDLGMIGDDYFANAAAIGLSPKIAETVPHLLKRWFGRAGYLSWATLQFVRFKPFTLIVGSGADAQRLKVVEVRISNGPFHGGTELVESAQLDSGQIVVQAVKGPLKRRLVHNWAASALRLKTRHEDVVEFSGTSLEIATEPPLPISIDGEVLAHTPTTARIAPGVIEVMAPRP
ncbi:diacylglycerol/lipid kinase family protein [Sphingomonas xinjiangensis]|uniref:YegS/Rv2252/BmrU family lipid kinase n=1 Tax=Sphingomonas xinjiangensis TaxID=643568 RepID=A0A840YNL9_9SPHN|nr:diacylglycerol kinase family protein [Sphingomonas xinjiangensis]MBB5709122.1 YegS/Rv2252/BmrU family lipid kinase [Sphingomonas xinjiangensis]